MNVTSIRANTLSFKANTPSGIKKRQPHRAKINKFEKLPSGAIAVNTVNMGTVVLPDVAYVTGAGYANLQTQEGAQPIWGTCFMAPGTGFSSPIALKGDPVANYEAFMKVATSRASQKRQIGYLHTPLDSSYVPMVAQPPGMTN